MKRKRERNLMRRSAFFVILAVMITVIFFSTTGCSDKKTATASDSLNVDSAAKDSTAADTLDDIISEEPMPKAADELFDDFIFNFAANRKLQMKRIKFPLPVYNGKKVYELQKNQWKMEHFFMRQDYYTLIFDNRRQMNVVKDTTISHVVIEKIYFRTKTVHQYIFDRLNGQWMMTAVNNNAMCQNNNASFLKFYQRFVTDSAFQIRSISDPLTFSGPNPDDDFGAPVTGTLVPEQWPSFAPELPRGFIYNIIYGQKYVESNQKIFVIRGIANGMETELTFRKVGGVWKLVKLTT